MKSIIIAIIAVTMSITTFGQVTEGKVSYTIDMSSDDPAMQSQFAMLQGSKMDMVFTEEFSRVEFSMGMIMKVITVTSIKDDVALMLMSGMMGNKAIKMSPEDITKTDDEMPKFEIEKTKETKKILGYKCTKYILTTEDGADISYWTTSDIAAAKKNNRYMIESIEGFPLAFEYYASGMKMTFTATEFKDTLKGMDKKELFEMSIPEGYEEMSMDDLKGMGM